MYEEKILEQIGLCEEQQKKCNIVDIEEFFKYSTRILSLAKTLDDYRLNKVFNEPSPNCRHNVFPVISDDFKEEIAETIEEALNK